MILRGLVLKQPWSWACILGGKDIENRKRPLKHRGPLVIVAGANNDPLYHKEAAEFMKRVVGVECPESYMVARGGIVGCVEMYDVVTPEQWQATPWHMLGQYGYRIRKAVPLPFRAIKGHQGLMRIEMTDAEIETIEAGGIACQGV